MSDKHRKHKGGKRHDRALAFGALGEETRLRLVAKLSSGEPASIAQLTQETHLTRQAVTKHLRVLERAGIVHSTRMGRESLFVFDPRPVKELHEYLERLSRRWDEAPAQFKPLAENWAH